MLSTFRDGFSSSFACLVTGCLCPSYPYRPGLDVLSGRGECFKRNNILYRTLVVKFFPAYNECLSNKKKRAIGAEIVTIVHEKGGRFLDTHGNELPEKLAIQKTMKALKDRRIQTRKSILVSTIPISLCSTVSSPVRGHVPTSLLPSKSQDLILPGQSMCRSSLLGSVSNRMHKNDRDDHEAISAPRTTLPPFYSAQAKAVHACKNTKAANLIHRIEGASSWENDKVNSLIYIEDDPFDEMCERELLAEVRANHSTCASQPFLPELFYR